MNCSLSTNNVLNPFTPFGDCSLVRMANLYANVCHVGTRDGHARVHGNDYATLGEAACGCPTTAWKSGKAADLVVLDCASPEQGVAELASPLYGFKRGRKTFTRTAAELHRP